MEAAKAPMRIMEDSRSPMVARCESDLNISDAQRFPRNKLVHSIEPKIMHKTPYSIRHNDGLPCGNSAQSSPIQMVEMGVRNEHKIDRRQML
jgi:hypothetical protein